MKTKELVKFLMELDPSGNIECCVDNRDITNIVAMPSHWDGILQTIEKDEEGFPIKIRLSTKGQKIKILCSDIDDLIYDYPNIEVDLEDIGNVDIRSRWEKNIEEWRKEAVSFQRELLEEQQKREEELKKISESDKEQIKKDKKLSKMFKRIIKAIKEEDIKTKVS